MVKKKRTHRITEGGSKNRKNDVFTEKRHFFGKKPLFLNFGLTYIDVFFDEESESDVIF